MALKRGRSDHRRDSFGRRGDLAELGEACHIDPLDEYVNDPAAGQPHGERVVVADPVGLEDGRTGLTDVERQLVDGTLHAAAGHAADDLVVADGRDGQRSARIPGCAALRTRDRGQAEAFAGLPPLGDPAQYAAHVRHLDCQRPN